MTTHYRQLTQGQRYQIEAGLSAAESQASIAKRVGVHPSTISREVRRNSTQNIYKAVSAAHESDATATAKPMVFLRSTFFIIINPWWSAPTKLPIKCSQRHSLPEFNT
jgi:transposase, IS30 family